MSERFDAAWLALREPFDAAARSTALAERLAAALPARPRLVDLGAGGLSLLRWLAPRLGRAQHWVCLDADSELLLQGIQHTAGWAVMQGWEVTWPKSGPYLLVLHTPDGDWTIAAAVRDLAADPAEAHRHHADALVCSALFDLVSAIWLARLAEGLEVPLLSCLNVDGRDQIRPPHEFDRLAAAGFLKDQVRDKGFGRALGPNAPKQMDTIFKEHGFTVWSAPSDWQIGPRAGAMLTTLISAKAQVAARHYPAHRTLLTGWQQERMRQTGLGRLVMRIGHRDILALPGR